MLDSRSVAHRLSCITCLLIFADHCITHFSYIRRHWWINVTGCGQICTEPLTSAPFGSPCMCVIPMKVRLRLGVSLYAIFPEVTELEIEFAAGTYLKQSQVAIIGASADNQDQEKTVVDINLVPLGDKFDNTTAILTYQRILHKKVPLNRTLFGDYDVLFIAYTGNKESIHLRSFCYPVSVLYAKCISCRAPFFSHIWHYFWWRSNWKYWRPPIPYYCRFCWQTSENEPSNYYCHFFISFCALGGLLCCSCCPTEVQECSQTIQCCWSSIHTINEQKIWYFSVMCGFILPNYQEMLHVLEVIESCEINIQSFHPNELLKLVLICEISFKFFLLIWQKWVRSGVSPRKLMNIVGVLSGLLYTFKSRRNLSCFLHV